MSTATEEIETILNISDKEVKYYDRDRAAQDSINNKDGIFKATYLSEPLIVKRERLSDRYLNYRFISINYYCFSSFDPIKWTLLNEFKVQDEFNLQKATTTFGGRNWIAWFSKEIPLPEGPYKFRGLPGLIFEVYDDKNNFAFKLLGTINYYSPATHNIVETNFGKKPIILNFKKFKEIQINNYNNLLSSFTDDDFPIGYGDSIINNRKELDNYKKMMQKNIRQNNNPIELSKGVFFK